ncbi:hypothetical protein [Mesorhizobium sp. WSM1293]|uniref:hypothetical protein n=1 Tax=Mesorhizobium sp. WSM1293 TaxID=1040984 RepID=UPI000489E5E1|nr:hypothetical protein [Mesorhizobium sp. WSM1293]
MASLACRQVHIHEVIDKNDAKVFRCSVSGQVSDHWLEIPAWMFDRVASANWRIIAVPHFDLAALGTLATLLHDIGVPSQSPEMGAALGSHAKRRDVHAAPAHDIPVRSVLEAERRQHEADAAMAALPAETRRSVTKLMVSLISGTSTARVP